MDLQNQKVMEMESVVMNESSQEEQMVIDFELTRYVNDSLNVANRLIGEAEEMIEKAEDEEGAKAAGIRAVEAWMVLNSAAVIGTRINAQKLLKSIRMSRNKIMAMGAALQKCGFMLQDTKESSMLFLRASPQVK